MRLFAQRFPGLLVVGAALLLHSGTSLFAVGGQLWSFGQNYNGQLCDGTTSSRNVPAQVVTGIIAVASGGSSTEGSQSFYLKTDGTLWAVGFNAYGQLGDGTTASRLSPVQVASGVSAVSAGINHSLFLKTDGTVWAMGLNAYGQLGDGTTVNRSTPVQVASGVGAIAAGGNHSVFLKTDGTVWTTGYNSFGQLGDGNKPNNRSTPVQIATGVSAIAAGGSHSLFIKTDATLWVTGWNASGQLGVGPGSSYLGTPAQLTTGVVAIAAGNQHSLYLKTDGTVWAMGQNLFGQLGDGTMPTNQKIPVQVASRVSAIAAGVSHSFFLKTDASLWAMGLNTSGQLGDGTSVNRSTPVQVTDEVLSVLGGSDSSYFIKAPGLTAQLDSWTEVTSGLTNDFHALIFEDGRFVAGAAGIAPAGGGGLSFISPDGLSWSSSSAGALANISLSGLAYGNSAYVGVGTVEVGSGGAITTSADGLTWSGGIGAPQALKDVTFGLSKFVAVGDAGLIQTSADGNTWTTRTSGTSNGLKGVAYGGGVFVAVGSSGTILTSPDGVTWTGRTAGASGVSNNLTSVIYGNSQFVAVGNGILSSTDGVSWTQRMAATGDGTDYRSVVYFLGQYVAVGINNSAQGAIVSSSDGIGWTAHNSGVSNALRAVSYGSNRFVVVGDRGTVLTSALAGSAPVVVTSPASQTVYAGSPASFSVTAAGAQPITYQWRKDNLAISGATGATYSIPAADTADAGSITAVVTNSAGSATSMPATLTVLKTSQTISFSAIPTHYYGDTSFTLAATAAPSGLPVTFSVVSGPVTISGSTVTITGVGSVTVRASQVGNVSYYAAPTVDRSFTVGKGTPTISWATPAPITYGTALSNTQLNASANIPGIFSYSPDVSAVLNAGLQTLSATFTPADLVNYNSAAPQQSLTVTKVAVSVSLSGLSATYDGAPHAANVTTSAGVLPVDLTYNGISTVPIAAGSYSVVGTVNSTNYSGSASGTLVIAKANQAITFNALADHFLGDAPFSISATASPTGYPVTLTVVAGPASISGNVVTLAGVGSVTIRATQLGDANFNAAPSVDRTFTVLNPLPVISWAAPASITYGTLLSATQLNASANVAGTFSYSPGSGALLNAGTNTISATFTPNDTANYSSATAQKTITVVKATPVLTWGTINPITYGVALGSTQLNANAGSIAGTITYFPAGGALLAVGTQTLTATFIPVDTTNYNSASAQQSLTVNRAVATITLGGLNAIYDGAAKAVTATTSAGALNIDITYNGSATAPSNIGSYAVVATINDANYSGTAGGTLTIAKADQSIDFGALSDRTMGDAPFGLSATANQSSLPVAFSIVSGPATLAGNTVTLTGAGTVTIRASQAGGTSYNAAPNVDRSFVVLRPTPTITWETPAAINYGEPLTSTHLNATASVPGVFVYSPTIGTILNAGSQTLTATFTPNDTANFSSAVAQQTLTVRKLVPVLTWSTPAPINYGTPLDSTQLNAAAGGVAGTFSYNPSPGAVLGIGVQTLTATFTPVDTVNYSAASLQQTITVNRVAVSVTLGGLRATYDGSPKSATATTSVGALNFDFTYNGSVSAPTNVGTYALVGTVNDVNYSGTASGIFTIVQAPQSIDFSSLADRTYGSVPFGLTATASPSALPVTFSVLSGPATVAGNIVTLTGVGPVTIRASQAGNGGYLAAAEVDRAFSVLKANPVITWAAPGAIASGTALSSIQLNATANVPGNFSYLPASGTVPSVGVKTLVATFTPTDTTLYNVITVQQVLTVSSVSDLPVFTTQPQSQAVFVGSNVTFVAAVRDAALPRFQWRKNGVLIPGATGATLTLTNIQVADGGSYALEASNAGGTVTSSFARLVVLVPQSNATAYGTTVSSTGVTVGGTVNLDYFLTNVGTKTWGMNHYLSIRDNNGTFVAFAPLIGVPPGESITAKLSFVAPSVPGAYTYFVQALESGVEFFSTQTTLTLTVLAQQPNSVTYNSTTFPISVAPGAGMNFNYNVTNTGTKTWGATHFLTLRDDSGNYSTFASLSGPITGQSKTVNLSFVAPATPGIYTYHVQALESGVEFFSTQANLTLVVLAPQPNSIVYNTTRFPDNVMPGSFVNLRYTLSNAGTAGWGANHYVSLRDSSGAFLSFIPLNNVTPGGSCSVGFDFVAPSAPGTYSYYVQALENGVEFFTTFDLVTLTVVGTPKANAISHNSTTFPSATVAAGTLVSFNSNVTNRGTKSWGPSHYLSLSDADGTFLGIMPIGGIAPGVSKTINFSFVAPTTPGMYKYFVQGFEDGVEFFGMTDTLILIVQ